MAKKNIIITQTTGIIKDTFEKYPNISLRKLAEYTSTNYNMLLKASKKPMVGVAYDPTQVNYEEVETYLRKKDIVLEDINWEEVASASSPIRAKESIEWKEGMRFTIRGLEENVIMEVLIVTTTHICFMEVGGTQPRVMSWNTFEHQTPKKVD